MKKYIVYHTKQGSKDGLMASGFDPMEVQERILDIIEDWNADAHDKHKVTIFDYTFAAVSLNPKDIGDFNTAREYLGGKPNMDYTVTQKLDSRNSVNLVDVSHLVRDLNPAHIKALIALNELFTLADAWSDAFYQQSHPGLPCSARQWQPTFVFKDGKLECTGASRAEAPGFFGGRLQLPTKGCATAFGHKFIDLFRKVIR